MHLLRRAATAFAVALAIPFFSAYAAGKTAIVPNVDVRVNDATTFKKQLAAPHVASQISESAIRGKVTGIARAIAASKKNNGNATARLSALTGGTEVISARKGALTPKSGASPSSIARKFVSDNRELFGLGAADVAAISERGASVNRRNGLAMVRLEQTINGRPVFGSDTRVLIDRDGGVRRVVSGFVPSPSAAPAATPTFSASQALVATMASVGLGVDAASITAVGSADVELTSTNPLISGKAYATLVYFPLAPGVVVPAWRTVVFSDTADYMTVVDATNGAVLWRKNIRNDASTQEARFSVYAKPNGIPYVSPAPATGPVAPGSGTQFPEVARNILAMSAVQDLIASQNGWIDDGGTTTTGNNVDAYVDRVVGGGETNVPDIGTIDNNGRPVGNPDANTLDRDFLGNAVRDFSYSPAPLGGNPNAGDTPTGTGVTQVNFRRGAVTQLFYVTNWYHDRLFQLGFDEAAGNFQQTNFSGFGAGADRVLAEAQDGSGTNNANFATPPDGQPGRMQMYRFTGPTPDRDGTIDSDIVIHELTHGLSNRLVGNADGLVWSPGQGLGEGWSDFYALSLLHGEDTDDPNAQYSSGGYATYQLGGLTDNYVYGIRRFPYSTDNTVNPLTWGDADDVTADMSGGIAPSPLGFEFNGALEVHNVGEIWALTLWEVRARIIADAAGANGDVSTGNETALQLVTDGLKMTPPHPSFIDGRDAILDADCATNACANEQWIWEGFADRGLGYGAVAPLGTVGFGNLGYVGVGESFSLPYLDYAGSSVDDASGNNNGAIDPGEPIRLTVSLLNPWAAASKSVASATATLTTSTAGITILNGSTTYGAIAPQGTTASTTPFVFLVSPSLTAGAPIDFTITTTSSLGTKAVTFKLRVGTESGTAAPVTFTRSSVGLGIPDGDPMGVNDTLTITDDLRIADVDFRLDSLTHTFTGDLVVGLRAPNGYASSLIWLREILFGGGDGDNFTNTVIDDESPNDLNQSFSTDAPYTGTWAPAFNSPVWLLFGDPAVFPDATGHLARLDDTSTKGDWQVFAADLFNFDAGTLNGWSLIVTPYAYTAAAFTPAVQLTAQQTVTPGLKIPGSAVTYTVTITNNGSAIQADNAGHEFVETFGPSLTVVSANATSGTVSLAGNTVNWDGVINPLGASVTITINATINAGTGGQTISAQAELTYDADANGANEATLLTDDPIPAGPADPNVFIVGSPANVTAALSWTGTATPGGAIVYTVTLSNSSANPQLDLPGDEFSVVLPAQLTLVSASAGSGTPLATIGTNTVTWNGVIAANGTATITINATINAGTAGATVTAQGTASFDANGDLTNESTSLSDDPAVAGATNPTSFLVGSPSILSATKSVTTSGIVGSPVTYTLVVTNSGANAQLDNPTDELTDVLPTQLALVSASTTSGTALATPATRTVTWNGSLAAGATTIITINAILSSGAAGEPVVNQGTVAYDSTGSGTNSASATTDDPSVAGAANPTTFAVVAPPQITATKTVSGAFKAGAPVTYTITLTNTGGSAQPDNATAEFTDVLPATLDLVSASANSGTAVATVATRTVTWNGTIAAGASVTITIQATISAAATAGTTISNQGTASFDPDMNGTNDATVLTDDPRVAGPADATAFAVIADIPALSPASLMFLSLCLAAAAFIAIRKS